MAKKDTKNSLKEVVTLKHPEASRKNIPTTELESVMNIADNVFVSTLTLPAPTPGLSDWWYYLPSTGQHVSFYTKEALCHIAARYQRHFYSNGSYHLFTRHPINASLFRLAMNAKSARFIKRIDRRASLVPTDFEQLARQSRLP